MGKLFDENVSSLDFSEFACGLQQAMEQGDFAACVAGIRRDEPSLTGVSAKPADNTYPAMVVCAGPTRAVAVIGGAVNMPLAETFFRSYFNDNLGVTGAQELNGFTKFVADAIQASFTSKGFLPGGSAVCIGHSFGGTVAQLVASRYHYLGGTSKGYYCSFGSPKWIRYDQVSQFRDPPGVRWMNDNDPIPLFPFTAADSLLTLLIVPAHLQIALTRFVQSARGVEIAPDGLTNPVPLPTRASVGNILTYPGYLLGVAQQPLQAHAISEYFTRLTTAAANERNPLVATRVSLDPEVPAFRTHRYYNAQEERVATAVSTAQAAQNRPVLDVPRQRVFRVNRQGRVFLVTFGDVAVALTSDRRTARSIAAQWNAALRHLQTMGYVNVENFLQQMQSYLAAASDPTSGFSPTMNTQLPL